MAEVCPMEKCEWVQPDGVCRYPGATCPRQEARRQAAARMELIREIQREVWARRKKKSDQPGKRYSGVSPMTDGHWMARIGIRRGVYKVIGVFDTEDEAVEAKIAAEAAKRTGVLDEWLARRRT